MFKLEVYAQTINNKAIGPLGKLDPASFLSKLLPALIALGFVIGAIVFIFYFLFGAVSWITSEGDKMKVEQAKNKITTAIVGLFVLLTLFAILNLVERFFGIGLRKIGIGPFNITLFK